MKDPSPLVVVAQTPEVLESARLPPMLIAGYGVHWGCRVALLAGGRRSGGCSYRSTLGFAIRTVGVNPSAARYAGISSAAPSC